jgi:cbb3-type cytochrome oxidase cytochrome c subunit
MELLGRSALCHRYKDDVDGLMAAVNKVNLPYPSKRLVKAEKDYHIQLKMELERTDELVKVKLECDRLQEENAALKAKVGHSD